MLEKQLSAILAQQLRAFIQNVNEEQLRLSLWSGDLVLHNLTLRPDVLDQVIKMVIANAEVEGGGSESAAAAAKALLLPFTVVEGVVSSLKISVPWTALLGEPVSVELDGVELVLGPLRSRPYIDDEETNRSGAIQSKQLQQFDRYRVKADASAATSSTQPATLAVPAAATGPSNSAATASSSSASSLITTIARNAHIVIRNVACKYLHDYADLHASLASMLEIKIEEIFVSTTDDEWRARFVSDPTMPICKQISLEGLMVKLYHQKDEIDVKATTNDSSPEGTSSKPKWKTCTTLLAGGDATIRAKAPAPQPKPVTPGSPPATPITDVLVQLNPMHMTVTFDAVKHLCAIAESLSSRYVDCSEYRRFLHTLLPSHGNSASLVIRRWKFAILAVKHHLGTRKRILQSDETSNTSARAQSQWEQMKTFCGLRREYIGLFKRLQHVRWLPLLDDKDIARVDHIESILRVDQIIFLRCLAHAELSFERDVDDRQRSLILNAEQKKPAATGSRWTSWMYRGGTTQAPASPVEPATASPSAMYVSLTPAEEREFIVKAFEAEWKIAAEYLFLKGRPHTVGNAAAPAAAAAAATAAAEAAASTASVMRLHFELSLFSLRLLPDLVVDDKQQRDPRYYHVSVLQGLKQSLLIQVGDMQADVNFGSKNVRHVVSSEIGFCKAYLESSWPEDHGGQVTTTPDDSVQPSWSICVLDSTALDPAASFEESTPLTSSFMTLGLTTDHHFEVLVQPLVVRLPLFDEIQWWAAAAQSLVLEITKLPFSSSTNLRASESPVVVAPAATPTAAMKVSIVLRRLALGVVLNVQKSSSAQSEIVCTLTKTEVMIDEHGALTVLLESLEVESTAPVSQCDDDHRVTLLRTGNWKVEVQQTSIDICHSEQIEAWLHLQCVAPIGDAIRGIHALNACRRPLRSRADLRSHTAASRDGEVTDELSPIVSSLLQESFEGVVWFDANSCALRVRNTHTKYSAMNIEWASYWGLRATLAVAGRRLAAVAATPLTRPLPGSPVTSLLHVSFGGLKLSFPVVLTPPANMSKDEFAELTISPSARSQETTSDGGSAALKLRIASSQTDVIDSTSVEIRSIAMTLGYDGGTLLHFPTTDVKLDSRTHTSASALTTSTTVDIRVREISDVVITGALVGSAEVLQAISSTFTAMIPSIPPVIDVVSPPPTTSNDFALTCVFDEGIRVELFETVATPNNSDTIEALVDHLYNIDESSPCKRNERSLLILDIDHLSASVVATDVETRISIDGSIGALQQVNPVVDGELFPVMGFGTSKSQYSPQKFEMKMSLPSPIITSPLPTQSGPTIPPPAVVVSGLLRGGKLCYNHPFFMKLSGIATDPVLARLSSMSTLPACVRGLTAYGTWVDAWQQSTAKIPAKAPESISSAWTKLDLSVEALEILCATDAAIAVVEETSTSYVRYLLDRVNVGSKLLMHNRRHPFLRTTVNIHGLFAEKDGEAWQSFAESFVGSKSGLYEFIGDAEVQISSNLLCLFDESAQQYLYQYTPSSENSTTLISLKKGGSAHQQATDLPSSSKGTVEMFLTLPQYTSLMSVLFRNILSPLVPTFPTVASPPISVLMFNAPSVCCRIMASERCVFALKLTEGMRFYQVAGGTLAAPQMALDLSLLVVEDCSPSSVDIDRSVPKEKQLLTLVPRLGNQKLVQARRISIRQQQKDEGGNKVATTDIEVDTVTTTPLVRPLFTLYDGLMNSAVVEMMATGAASASPSLVVNDHNQNVESVQVTARTVVDVRGCTVHFCEPWGEELAELRMDLTRLQIENLSDLSQRMNIDVAEPFTLRHALFDETALSMDDVPYRYQCLVSSSSYRQGHSGGPVAAVAPSHGGELAPIITVAITIPPPVVPPVAFHAGAVFSEQPQPADFGEVVVSARDFVVVGLPQPWLRFLQYINGEFMDIANLTYTPQQRASFGVVPYFGFSGLNIAVENTTILVPCSITSPSLDDITTTTSQMKRLGNGVELDCFEIGIRQVAASNRFYWSEGAVQRKPHSSIETPTSQQQLQQQQEHQTLASVQEFMLTVNDVAVFHSHHRRPNDIALLTIECVELAAPAVLPTDCITSTPQLEGWRILPISELDGALFRQDLTVTVARATVTAQPLMIPSIQRCLEVMQSSSFLTATDDKYYVIVATKPYVFQQDVKLSAVETVISLIEPPEPCLNSNGLTTRGDTLTSTIASHFSHRQHQTQSSTMNPVRNSVILSVSVGEINTELATRGSTSTIVLTVPQKLTVTDHDDNVLVCRAPSASEDDGPTCFVHMVTTEINTTSPTHTAPSRNGSTESLPVSSQRILIETANLFVIAQHSAIDSALRLQEFMAHIPEVTQSKGASLPLATEQPASTTQAPLLTVRCRKTALQITNAAVLHIRSATLTPSASPSDTTVASHQIISVDGVTLTRPKSYVSFVEIGSAEVKIGTGDLQVRIQRTRIYNYSSAFFIGVIDAANSLQDYIHLNTKLPVEQDEGYRQTMLISLRDLKVSLFPGGAESPRAPRLDFVFPGFVVRSVQTTSSSDTSIDSEDGSIVYEHPHAQITALPICKGMALTFHLSSNELLATSSTNVKLGPISIVVPIGSVLQNFVEVVATSMVPFSKVVLFPAAPENVDNANEAARRRSHATNDVISTASQVISLVAPKLSIHVCDAVTATHTNTDDAHQHRDVTRTLFGVDIHKVRFEHRITQNTDKVEVSVFEITSVVDRTIQNLLLTASPMPLDDELIPAILVVREVVISSAASQQQGESDGGVMIASAKSSAARVKNDRVTARLHKLDVTISPALLGMINENILERVAIATKRVKEQRAAASVAEAGATNASEAKHSRPAQMSTPKRPTHPFSSSASRHSAVSSSHSRPQSGPSKMGGASSHLLPCAASVISISSMEHVVKQDIVLGGRHGSILYFSKSGSLSAAKHPSTNTIQFFAPAGGVATVYLSYAEGNDGQLYFPIVVEPGLSVLTEGIRFVLPPNSPPSLSLLDFVFMGERSLLHCDNTMVIRAAPSHQAGSISKTPSLFRPPMTTSDLSVRYVKSVEILASIALRCWSFHQSVAVTTEIRGHYRSEAVRRDDLTAVSTDRILLDEQGDLSISNLSIVSDAGNITSEPTGVVLHIGYFKPSDDDDVKIGGPRTSVRAIIPASTFMMSIGHAKLMYDIIGALQRGSEHIGSIDLVGGDTTSDDDDDQPPSEDTAREPSEAPSPVKSTTHNKNNSGTHSLAKRAFVALPSHVAQQSSGASTKSSRVEFGVTAPQFCVIVTDDFFHPIVVASIDNFALQGHTTRAVTDVNLTLSMEVSVRDYPEVPLPLSMSSDGSRLLLSTAPEVAIDYTTIQCGASKELGFAVQIAVAAAEFDATLPVNTLQKLFAYQFSEQKTGAHSFVNNIGVPLLLMSTDVHNSNSAAPSICELPIDVVVKADIFRYDQTLFRVLQTTPQAVRQNNGASASQIPQGQIVDLRWLHSGACVGLAFLASAYQHSLCEIIMRLDTLERKVTFASLVTFVNKLTDCAIVLPSPEEHFTVDPKGGCISAPIPVLQHAMQLCMLSTSHSCQWALLDSVAATSFCQWDTLLGAFCSASDEDLSDAEGGASSATAALMSMKSTSRFDNGVLSFPLTLRRVATQSADHLAHENDGGGLSQETPASSAAPATRCVLLQIHRQPISSYIDASHATGSAAATSTKYEIFVTVAPVTRFVNCVGMDILLRLTSTSAKRFEEVAIKAESGADWFEPIVFDASAPTTIELTVSGTTLRSARPCVLPELPSIDTWIALTDESSREVYLRVCRDAASGHFHFSSAAVVENRTRFAVEVISGLTGALIAGQAEQRGIDPLSSGSDAARLLVGYPRPKMEPVSLRARVCRPGATLSQPFQATSLLPSSLLSCGEGHLVHIFSARREVTDTTQPSNEHNAVLSIPTLLQCPRIILEPTWWLVNQHPSLLLFTQAVGLEEHVSSISPSESHALTTFHASCGADPEIQLCYSADGNPTFEWSPRLPLATLTSVGTCRTIRHKVRPGADTLHSSALVNTPIYANRTATVANLSGDEQLFTCMKVVTTRHASGSVFVSCHLANSEVLIENRTSSNVIFTTSSKGFKSSPASEQFVVPSFSDTAAAWIGTNPTEPFVLHLHVTTVKGKKHTIALDLLTQSTVRDAMPIGSDGAMWILTTYNAARHMYHVAVVASRMLEGVLVPQPRSMINMEAFCRRIQVHVAACFVHSSQLNQVHSRKQVTLDQLPISTSARRRVLWCCSTDVMQDDGANANTKKLDAKLLTMISRVELDVLRLDIESVYLNACSNGAHQFGEFSVQSLNVHDCSVEAPHFPTILAINGKNLRSSSPLYHSTDEPPQPAITVRAHFGASNVVSSTAIQVHEEQTTFVRATSIQMLQIHIEPIIVKLADALLFNTRCVATVALLQLAALNEKKQSPSLMVNSTHHRNVPTQCGSVRCRIERLNIDMLQVQFTLHRRSDGRYNPFEGLPIGFLVPSIEEAPLNLGDLVLADVLQAGSTTAECVLNCIIPYFRSRAILQAFKVVGSMELIGNPMMFASNVSSGVRSFVKDTVDLHPWQGTKTLFASTTSSALHSLALLSKVGGRATAALSRDTEWLSARETAQAEQTSLRGRGLLMGFANGVVSGVAGVVRDPVRGIKANGATGFCGGLITGVVGVVSRPVSGMLDGLANTAEDLSTAMKPVDPLLSSGNVGKAGNDATTPVMSSRNFRPFLGSISSELDEVESVVSSVSKSATPGQSPRSAATPNGNSSSSLARSGMFIERNRFLQIACASTNTSPTERERWRSLFQTLGAHNVARHAPWKEFLKYSTPQEFQETVHLALEGILTRSLVELRSGALLPASTPTAVGDSKETIALEYRIRALNIKTSLGPSDALKFVRLEQFVSIACLSEIKLAMSVDDLQRKAAPVLKDHAEEIVAQLLKASWL